MNRNLTRILPVKAPLPAEALPVDVQVGDACALTGFQFRSIAGPLLLPAGSYDVNVRLAARPACSGAVASSAPGLVLAAGADVSILAHPRPQALAIAT